VAECGVRAGGKRTSSAENVTFRGFVSLEAHKLLCKRVDCSWYFLVRRIINYKLAFPMALSYLRSVNVIHHA
jgi:hypothetical protein